MNRTVLLSDLTFHSYGSRTPSAALRRLRAFLLMPQPPLLFKEGNVSALKQSVNSFPGLCSNAASRLNQFVHTFSRAAQRGCPIGRALHAIPSSETPLL